jgi:hypothetical protein
LHKLSNVFWFEVFNASAIDNPRCNKIGSDEVFEPIGSVVIDFVVQDIGGHGGSR